MSHVINMELVIWILNAKICLLKGLKSEFEFSILRFSWNGGGHPWNKTLLQRWGRFVDYENQRPAKTSGQPPTYPVQIQKTIVGFVRAWWADGSVGVVRMKQLTLLAARIASAVCNVTLIAFKYKPLRDVSTFQCSHEFFPQDSIHLRVKSQ
jgi:hypothetical protein